MKKVIILLILSVIIISAKSQEILTPELLWKLGRVSEMHNYHQMGNKFYLESPIMT